MKGRKGDLKRSGEKRGWRRRRTMSGPEEDVKLNPGDQVHFEGPFSEPRTVPLKMKNGAKKRVTYKMKSTRGDRFKLIPPFGFIEPGAEAVVKMTCIPFDASKHIPVHDRITVLLAVAPENAPPRAFDVWKHNQPLEPQKPRRVPLPVVYRPGSTDAKPAKGKEGVGEKKEEKEKKKEEDEDEDSGESSEGSGEDGSSEDESGESGESED